MYNYVINLDRSVERWEKISSKASQYGMKLTRIAAIDGRIVPMSDWADFDVSAFRRNNGREPLSGEYGCYLSHIAALRRFLEDGGNSALIMEDDARLNENVCQTLSEIEAQFQNEAVLIRLTVHRATGFESMLVMKINENKTANLGHCWFGPNGSAAAYWITKKAAENLLAAALPARMPFDMLLERPWEYDALSLLFRPNVMEIPNPPFSELGSTYVPGSTGKYRFYKRTGALMFRTAQLVKRLLFCAGHRILPTKII